MRYRPSVIVQYWLQDTLSSWMIPFEIWHLMEGTFRLANDHFAGDEKNTVEIEEAIACLDTLMFGDEGDAQTAPWSKYTIKAGEPFNKVPVACLYITGSDPC